MSFGNIATSNLSLSKRSVQQEVSMKRSRQQEVSMKSSCQQEVSMQEQGQF
jgi:hypothetical protein